MWNLIVSNKEWLFSGVGVTLIFVLIPSVVKKLRKSDAGGNAQIIVLNVTQKNKNEIVKSEELLPAHITKIAPITFDDIYKALSSAPPLQKKQIAKNYLGLYIRWEAYLFNADLKDNNNIALALDFCKKSLTARMIHCNVKLSDYRELGVLNKGAPITVVGRISEVDSLGVRLEEVALYFEA
jgi:hypothetical protein